MRKKRQSIHTSIVHDPPPGGFLARLTRTVRGPLVHAPNKYSESVHCFDKTALVPHIIRVLQHEGWEGYRRKPVIALNASGGLVGDSRCLENSILLLNLGA